jgi:hypothetical protein
MCLSCVSPSTTKSKCAREALAPPLPTASRKLGRAGRGYRSYDQAVADLASNPTFATDQASGSLSQAGAPRGDPPSCLAGLPKNHPSCEAGNLLRALFPHTGRANQISRIKSRCTKLIYGSRAYYFATCCRNVAYPSQSNQPRHRASLCTVSGCWGRILWKRTNFEIPNEINAVRRRRVPGPSAICVIAPAARLALS